MNDSYSYENILDDFGFNASRINLTENVFRLVDSLSILINSRKINMFAVIIVIIMGLIGNMITITMFAQKRFRINSSHVYLLFLAVVDSLVLILTIFEDTIRSYISIYMNDSIDSEYHIFQHKTICRLIVYFQYAFKFISAYTQVVFTLQRLMIVYRPLSTYFKSKCSACKTAACITIVSFLLNLWVPFMFQANINDQDAIFCEISRDFKVECFNLNGIYVSLMIVLPLLVILIANSLIIYKTVQDDKNRKKLQELSRLDETNKKANENKTLIEMLSLSTPRSSFSAFSNRQSGVNDIVSLRTPKSSCSAFSAKRLSSGANEASISFNTLKSSCSIYSNKLSGMNDSVFAAGLSTSKSSFSAFSSNKPSGVNEIVSLSMPKTFSAKRLSSSFNEMAFFGNNLTKQSESPKKVEKSANKKPKALKLSEIFYYINFSIKFYIYVFASGSIRRDQSKKKEAKVREKMKQDLLKNGRNSNTFQSKKRSTIQKKPSRKKVVL